MTVSCACNYTNWGSSKFDELLQNTLMLLLQQLLTHFICVFSTFCQIHLLPGPRGQWPKHSLHDWWEKTLFNKLWDCHMRHKTCLTFINESAHQSQWFTRFAEFSKGESTQHFMTVWCFNEACRELTVYFYRKVRALLSHTVKYLGQIDLYLHYSAYEGISNGTQYTQWCSQSVLHCLNLRTLINQVSVKCKHTYISCNKY